MLTSAPKTMDRILDLAIFYDNEYILNQLLGKCYPWESLRGRSH